MVKALVHGNPETEALWGPLAGALAERGVHDVVRLSPPGFGAPTPPGWDATPAAYADWLARELEALDDPVDVVGHDWGAGHTYGLLARRPQLVRSWAADCAGLLHPDYQWHDLAQVWQQADAGEAWVQRMLATPVEDRVAVYGSLGIGPNVAGPMASAFDAEMGRCILALYRGAAQPVMAELGQRLAAGPLPPGLVLNPDDPYVPAHLAREVAGGLGAEILELGGLGHWWMVQDPGRAADGLVRFWAGL